MCQHILLKAKSVLCNIYNTYYKSNQQNAK